jgi:hypothetical protein
MGWWWRVSGREYGVKVGEKLAGEVKVGRRDGWRGK